MILSSSYKQAMDKIQMSDELKQRIISASVKGDKKRKFILKPVHFGTAAAGLAACLALAFAINGAVTKKSTQPKEVSQELAMIEETADMKDAGSDGTATPVTESASEQPGAVSEPAAGTETAKTAPVRQSPAASPGGSGAAADGQKTVSPDPEPDTEPDTEPDPKPDTVGIANADDVNAEPAAEPVPQRAAGPVLAAKQTEADAAAEASEPDAVADTGPMAVASAAVAAEPAPRVRSGGGGGGGDTTQATAVPTEEPAEKPAEEIKEE